MRYIDRKFLFPVVAATAWSQQPPQPSPAAAEAEAALRDRVAQFYQLQVDKKFRQVEDLVAEDTKDDYYNGAKPNIKGFSIQQIELLDDNKRARVTIKAKATLRVPQLAAQEFEMPAVTSWKIENGQWVWYIDRDLATQTPFGPIKTPSGTANGPVDQPPRPQMNLETLMSLVTVDRTSVSLSASNPVETVTVSNNMPGSITLELTDPQLAGISVELEKADLKPGEKSAVRFRLTGEAKGSRVVHLAASPLNKVFEIQVSSN